MLFVVFRVLKSISYASRTIIRSWSCSFENWLWKVGYPNIKAVDSTIYIFKRLAQFMLCSIFNINRLHQYVKFYAVFHISYLWAKKKFSMFQFLLKVFLFFSLPLSFFDSCSFNSVAILNSCWNQQSRAKLKLFPKLRFQMTYFVNDTKHQRNLAGNGWKSWKYYVLLINWWVFVMSVICNTFNT